MSATSPDPADVKVSVAMITYNHERFIAQAIESVLMQQTDFAVELVIGEDCSTDGTRAIVRDYGERYPERIRLLLPEHNLGMMPNFVATLKACRGQYVASVEGDDYWTDPHKLQKQVDFLESASGVQSVLSMKHTISGRMVAKWNTSDPDSLPSSPCTRSKTSSPVTSSRLHPWFFVTAWWMNRIRTFSRLQLATGCSTSCSPKRESLAFLDENWSVRRIHPGGATSMAAVESVAKHVLLSANIIDHYLGHKFRHVLRPIVLGNLVDIITEVAYSASSPGSAAAAIRLTLDRYAGSIELNPSERRNVLNESHYRLVFRMRDRKDTPSTRYYWWKTLGAGYKPALRNRGYWSIGLDAMVGKGRAASLHQLFRRLR